MSRRTKPGLAPESAPTPRAQKATAAAPPEAATRQRLLDAALRCFAERGFARASTREIGLAAECNIALIAYHFGDKGGLYRAVLGLPLQQLAPVAALYDRDEMPLAEWLDGIYRLLLAPLRESDVRFRHVMRIWGREMTDPTEIGQSFCAECVEPHRLALQAALGRRCGARRVDLPLQHLTFAVMAIIEQYWNSVDIIQNSTPQVLGSARAITMLQASLVRMAQAMIEAESSRRRSGGDPPD
ncbi:TetR/AcrR family transcriptional regulator [Roseateles sp. BYS180W]|uniref:TetR/AcrR family transcriptional regulator n=1 Tax=Roseateles rivi TaxID=3299028 RepID=A0ABW7FSD1_9BURK